MKSLMKGNEALAEAAIQAGCRHYFGYPITPQSELTAYLAKQLPKVGGVYLQAESEVASINMVLGAAAAGARVMTSSSSPGISLMSEGLSYLAGCDLPAVLVNIQRGGPGLGGIQPSQADYFQATRSSGHGDFHMLVLAPNSVQEMVDCTYTAFDLADKYRMTAMILGDGILGQMMEPVEMTPPVAVDLPPKDWAVTGTANHAGRNTVTSLYLQPEELERTNRDRFDKYKVIQNTEVRSEAYLLDDADIVVVAYGATSRIAKNAILAAREQGVKAGMLRPVTLWPFPAAALKQAAQTAKAFVAVEMSMGQMIDDVKLAVECSRPVSLCGHTGGVVPSRDEIVDAIMTANKEVK